MAGHREHALVQPAEKSQLISHDSTIADTEAGSETGTTTLELEGEKPASTQLIGEPLSTETLPPDQGAPLASAQREPTQVCSGVPPAAGASEIMVNIACDEKEEISQAHGTAWTAVSTSVSQPAELTSPSSPPILEGVSIPTISEAADALPGADLSVLEASPALAAPVQALLEATNVTRATAQAEPSLAPAETVSELSLAESPSIPLPITVPPAVPLLILGDAAWAPWLAVVVTFGLLVSLQQLVL